MLFDILSHSLCFSLNVHNFVILLNHLYRCFRHLDTSHKHFSLYFLRISIFSQITQFHFYTYEISDLFEFVQNIPQTISLLFYVFPLSQDLIKDRILPWLLTLQQSLLSQFCYMLSRKCLAQLQYFISTASSLWPTFVLHCWQMQQQRGDNQRKTSISLRKMYMKWRIHTSITAPSTVGSNPNNLWAPITFQRHQIQPLHFGAWCCLL